MLTINNVSLLLYPVSSIMKLFEDFWDRKLAKKSERRYQQIQDDNEAAIEAQREAARRHNEAMRARIRAERAATAQKSPREASDRRRRDAERRRAEELAPHKLRYGENSKFMRDWEADMKAQDEEKERIRSIFGPEYPSTVRDDREQQETAEYAQKILQQLRVSDNNANTSSPGVEEVFRANLWINYSNGRRPPPTITPSTLMIVSDGETDGK